MSSDKRTLCHLHHTTSRNIWCSCPSIGSVNERNSEGNQGRRWWRADSSDLQLNDSLGSLEHFPEKWTPVFRKEMRPSIESRARSCPRPRRILLNLFGTRSSGHRPTIIRSPRRRGRAALAHLEAGRHRRGANTRMASGASAANCAAYLRTFSTMPEPQR